MDAHLGVALAGEDVGVEAEKVAGEFREPLHDLVVPVGDAETKSLGVQ